MKQQDYRAALYLRLSRDDDCAGDSGSIRTQQMILERYCEEQGFLIQGLYIDDGYSGLNFDRPGFLRMLEDIRLGLVNLVVTKDLSRLGRDYIQTGQYTELFFPQHGVRYIALGDGVDTLQENNDIAPFKNILNDMYARDLSRKVKTAKRARAAQGAFTGSHAPYGYRQQADNCNVLEVNEETAPVVRRIFRLALEGLGAATIANRLEAEQILTPSAYKYRQGEPHFARLYEGAPIEAQYRWACSTVHRILGDSVYLGHMVGHKTQVDHYKTKRRSPVPKEQQIVVEGTHPPLVSREDFDKVQLLAHARRVRPKTGGENLFQALLYCGECGHRLSLATKRERGREIKYYRCMHHYRFPQECTGAHFIRYEQLYQLVLEDLGRIGALLLPRARRLARALSEPESGKPREQEAKLQSRYQVTCAIIGRLYEDFAAGRTAEHNYQRLLAQYQREQEQLQSALEKLHTPPQECERARRLELMGEAVENALRVRALDTPLLHELIQRIHVGQREKAGGQWLQDIRIEYRFSGDFPEQGG